MATQRDIADHLGITQPAVAGLVRDGVITPAARGSYDLDVARLAYCSHLREQAAGRASQPGAAFDLATERARLAAAQAEAQERKNARERGELVDLVEITNTFTGLIELTKAYLSRVGAVVAKGDAALRQRIDQAVNDALIDLSDIEVIDMTATTQTGAIEPEG
jgi:phage terminase Nu1 subunit (DNA packaging protein)